ncbi:putative RTA1 domain protein [Powellomyces hirtus]|nr:putative RTA1 domain protein [Powellomyces hirtus]
MSNPKCTLDICPIEYAWIHYLPSLIGNSVYLAAFSVLFAAHIALALRYRTWGFSVGMIGGILLEILGYIGRVLLHRDPFNFDSFLLYLICLTIGPAFMSASTYLCLGRIITVNGSYLSRLSPRTYTIVFIICDFISLVLQSIGGAIASIADTKEFSDVGVNIMIAGLVSQVVSLALFMACWAELAFKLRKTPETEKNPAFSSLRASRAFSAFRISLVVATVAIFIRSTFRVVELQGGFSGPIANDETLFMIFEGPMILLAVAVMTVCHPGRVFGGSWDAAGFETAQKSDRSPDVKNDIETLVVS